MTRFAAFLLWLTASAAQAACPGTDLIAALPAEDRAALEAQAAAKAYPKGILWRAEKDGRTLFLVGTMHLHDPRHADTLARIDPWLQAAGTVFLELGQGDEKRLQAMIAEEPDLAFITEGPTLPDLLAPEDWEALTAAMQERGFPGFLVAKMKPWMALANLSMSRCDMENMQKGLRGLDAMIMDRAAELGKPAKALEPIETILTLFAAYSMEEQLELLRLSLSQVFQDSADQTVTVAESYFREDIQLIWEFTEWLSAQTPDLTPEELAEQMAKMEDLMIVQRNTAWMDLILASETDDLIAVGALHMPGEYGLLRLLEAEGFSITRETLRP